MRLNNQLDMTWKEMALSHHPTGRTEENLVILGHVGRCTCQDSKRAPLKHGSEETPFPQACFVLVCVTYSAASIRIQRYTSKCTIITGFEETA